MTITTIRKWLPLVLILLCLSLFFYFNLQRFLSFDALKQHRRMLQTWTERHYLLAVIGFVSIYTISIAVSIPGATFLTLAGGFLFGIVWGSVFVVFSATLGATIIFLAVRSALSEWVAAKTGTWVEKMRTGFQRGAFEYLLFLRLVPVFPFWVVNIVPGLLGVRASTFIIATFFGIIPGSIVYVSLGNGLGYLFDQDQTPNLGIIFEPHILVPLLLLAALSIMPVIYRAIKRKWA